MEAGRRLPAPLVHVEFDGVHAGLGLRLQCRQDRGLPEDDTALSVDLVAQFDMEADTCSPLPGALRTLFAGVGQGVLEGQQHVEGQFIEVHGPSVSRPLGEPATRAPCPATSYRV